MKLSRSWPVIAMMACSTAFTAAVAIWFQPRGETTWLAFAGITVLEAGFCLYLALYVRANHVYANDEGIVVVKKKIPYLFPWDTFMRFVIIHVLSHKQILIIYKNKESFSAEMRDAAVSQLPYRKKAKQLLSQHATVMDPQKKHSKTE